MSRGGKLCLVSEEQCCLGLDRLVGKTGGSIIFEVDNFAHDTSTEHIKYWHILLPDSVSSDKSLFLSNSRKGSFLIRCSSKDEKLMYLFCIV